MARILTSKFAPHPTGLPAEVVDALSKPSMDTTAPPVRDGWRIEVESVISGVTHGFVSMDGAANMLEHLFRRHFMNPSPDAQVATSRDADPRFLPSRSSLGQPRAARPS